MDRILGLALPVMQVRMEERMANLQGLYISDAVPKSGQKSENSAFRETAGRYGARLH